MHHGNQYSYPIRLIYYHHYHQEIKNVGIVRVSHEKNPPYHLMFYIFSIVLVYSWNLTMHIVYYIVVLCHHSFHPNS